MNPYDKELEPGDRMTFTDEVEPHLSSLGIAHDFGYGDEMVVLDRDDNRAMNVKIGDPRVPGWEAWVSLVIAENANSFWLRQQELRHENEGVSSPLPFAYYNGQYKRLSPDERRALWRQGTPDYRTVWKLLVNRDLGDESHG